eukprot:scaffold386314_cov35-Attheya_sp.AAC.2
MYSSYSSKRSPPLYRGVSFVGDRHRGHYRSDLDGDVHFGRGGSDGFRAGSGGFRAHHDGNAHGRNLQRIPTRSQFRGHPEPSLSNGTDVGLDDLEIVSGHPQQRIPSGSLALERAEPYHPTERAVRFDEVEFVGPHHYPQQRIPTGSLVQGGPSRAHHDGNAHGRNLQRIPTRSQVCGHPEPSFSNGTDVGFDDLEIVSGHPQQRIPSGSLALERAEPEPYHPTERAVRFDEVEFIGPHHYPQQRIPTGSLVQGGPSRAVCYEGVEGVDLAGGNIIPQRRILPGSLSLDSPEPRHSNRSAACFDEVECVSPLQFPQQRILARSLAPRVELAGGNNIPQQHTSSASFSLEHPVHYYSTNGPVSLDKVEFVNPHPYPQQHIRASPLALEGQVSSPSNERSVCCGEKGLVSRHPKAQQLISEDSVSPQGFLALYNGVRGTFFPHDDPVHLDPPKSIEISSASSSTHSSIISNDETTTKGYPPDQFSTEDVDLLSSFLTLS